jgi:hypothetical protein
MRFFWYLSKTKLDHLLSQQKTPLDSLNAGLASLIKAEIKVPFVSVGLERKSSEVDAKQIRALEKVEKKLRDSGAVGAIGDYSAGRQPLFFDFHGPAARLIQDGQFWIASLEGRTAVLLAGSATHCIGGPNPVENVISPSVDPMGSIQSLMSHHRQTEDKQLANELSFIWAMIASNSNVGEFDSLPRTKGIAIFAGTTKGDSAQIQCSGYDGDIDQIIVGSPLFVEQVASLS